MSSEALVGDYPFARAVAVDNVELGDHLELARVAEVARVYPEVSEYRAKAVLALIQDVCNIYRVVDDGSIGIAGIGRTDDAGDPRSVQVVGSVAQTTDIERRHHRLFAQGEGLRKIWRGGICDVSAGIS